MATRIDDAGVQPNQPRRARHRFGGLLGALLAAVLGAGVVGVPPANAQPVPPGPLRPQVEQLDRDGGEVRGVGRQVPARTPYSVPAPVWPAAGTARVTLPPARAAQSAPLRATGSAVRAGKLPVSVDRAPGAAGQRLTEVNVTVLDRAAVAPAWRNGLVLRIGGGAPADGAGSATARVSVDYAAFRYAFGADWASRLRLYRLPDCALGASTGRGCVATPLPSTNDSGAAVVTADVPVSADAAAGQRTAAAAQGTLLALAAAPSGDAGDFSATSLAASSTWVSGNSSGDFSWSYPMRVPPAMGGPTPSLNLSYSSSSVDGRSAATNNQPSWVGEGFELSPGYIERRYVPCSEDKAGSPNNPELTADLCWRSDNATLSLNGGGGELVWQKDKGWHNRTEDGAKIEKVTGGQNGDDNGEYWKVTSNDGTQYFFGLNNLPGQSLDTNSTWTVPVYGNHDGEECHGKTFAESDCPQAWRWNLDYVVDARGNTMSYWYNRETNQYATRADDDNDIPYTRGGTLDRIDYGTWDRKDKNGNIDRSIAPAAQVSFETAERCEKDCTKHDGTHWPDVPWDQECKSGATSCDGLYSPTFWSTQRLKKITTRVWDSTKATPGWQNVDSWTFGHSFPSVGDGTHGGLWLNSVVHAGEVGGTKALPPVTFTPVAMANRVLTKQNTSNNWQRLANIQTETGALIQVSYQPAECAANRLPAEEHTNTMLCYPVKGPNPYDPDGADITEWWHKYVVRQVSETDVQLSGGHQTPTRNTYYEYVGEPAWHYADDDGLIRPRRKTWSQFRGFSAVRTRLGDHAQTLTKTTFLRGMHGDKAAPAGGTRSVTVPASLGSETVYDEDAFAGMVREVVTYNGTEDKPVSKTVNVPWQSAPTAQRTINKDTVTARFINTQAVYQGTALGVDGARGWRVSRVRSEYDDTYGTLSWSQDDGDHVAPGDEKCTAYTYHRNTGKNIVTLAKRVTTTALPCGRAATTEAHMISDVRNSYDGGGTETLPAYGSLSKVEQLKTWTAAKGTDFQTVSESTFDPFGRPLTATDVRRNVIATAYTPAGRGPVTSTTVTNAKGWATVTAMNPYWGSPKKITDPNGRVSEADYDEFGRTVRVWNVGWSRDSHLSQPSVRYEYSYAPDRKAYPYIKTEALNPTGNYNTTVQILDAFLRPRQTQTIGARRGERVVTDTIYDEWGREAAAYGAHAEPGDPSGTLWWEPEWSLPSITKTDYDRAGRAYRSTFLSGDGETNLVERWHTTTVHAGDETRVTPPLGGTPTTTVTDIQGRTVELRQHTSVAGVTGAYQKTTYAYDARGKLRKVTDPAGDEWSYRFDVKGRQIEAKDPDKGTATSEYNDYDDVSSTTDGNGEKLAYRYDSLGRKVGVYDDVVSDATKRAEWTYDEMYDGRQVRGHLTRTTRYDAGQEYTWQVGSFNARYQPTSVDYLIPRSEGAIGGTWTFLTSYSDVDGSPTTLTYPVGGGLPAESVTTGYDEFTGLPDKLTTLAPNVGSYVNQQVYSSYGEPTLTRRQTAGGQFVEEASTYDTYTRRLSRVQIKAEKATGTIADRRYDYDAAGNVLSVADTPQVGAADTQCFRYDLLRRLTSAWTPKAGVECKTDPAVAALGGPAPYWYDWTIDGLGNRTQEVSRSSTAETTRTFTVPKPGLGVVRPHAVTAVSTQVTGQPATTVSYGYDNAGNMVRRPGPGGAEQVLTWDAEGRAAKVTDAASTTTNLYDPAGARLIRRDGKGTTLYLPGMEVRAETTPTPAPARATRYYSLSGKVVACRTPGSQALTWLFNDHQGTQQLSVDAYTMAVSVRRQTPYGSPRGDQPTWSNQKGFVGGDLDPSGLTHVGAREYDPALGRFISVDPVQDLNDPQQWNGYAYANNTPVTASDPTGLMLDCSPDGIRWVSCGAPVYNRTKGKGHGNSSPSSGQPKRNPGPSGRGNGGGGQTPNPQPWGDGRPAEPQLPPCGTVRVAGTCVPANSPQIRQGNLRNGSTEFALGWANWFGANGGDCELGAAQIICFEVNGPWAGDHPMTIGDVLLYPKTREDLRTLVEEDEPEARAELGKMRDKRGKGLDVNVFGPDLLGHEKAHSEQWTKYDSVGGFTGSYLDQSARSWKNCGDPGDCNRFEVTANAFKGGYWGRPVLVNGEFTMPDDAPDLDTVERLMR